MGFRFCLAGDGCSPVVDLCPCFGPSIRALQFSLYHSSFSGNRVRSFRSMIALKWQVARLPVVILLSAGADVLLNLASEPFILSVTVCRCCHFLCLQLWICRSRFICKRDCDLVTGNRYLYPLTAHLGWNPCNPGIPAHLLLSPLYASKTVPISSSQSFYIRSTSFYSLPLLSPFHLLQTSS